ncbi:MAG: ABC transporter permease [Phycisphaeraceae bacterium]|nr:ABC transporter permease [Phycisphaeraceae bacterium]
MARLPLDYAVRNLGRSPLRAGLSVLGACLVVLLIIAAAGFVTGMSRSLRASGDDRHVILLGAGSEESIERSEIPASVGSLVAAAVPGLETSMGVPHVSAEVHVQLPVRATPDADNPRLLLIRGVTPAAMLVHRSVQITEGRFPRAGHDEIMLGSAAPRQLGLAESDLAVGSTLWIDKSRWTIVGRFAAPGTVMQAEAWTALTDLKAATKRETDSCVVLALGDAEFADIDAFARQRLDLELTAIPETRYYAGLASFFRPVQAVVWATALLIAAGGLLGGLNTMYAAFSSRVRELGMLQCLGYRRGAIVLSLVQESLLAASAGAVLASIVGLAMLDGLAVRFSTGVFGLVVDHTVVALGLAAGLALGLIGALPPALRALRLPIPESLKAA